MAGEKNEAPDGKYGHDFGTLTCDQDKIVNSR
jgi:hypothetical protein